MNNFEVLENAQLEVIDGGKVNINWNAVASQGGSLLGGVIGGSFGPVGAVIGGEIGSMAGAALYDGLTKNC